MPIKQIHYEVVKGEKRWTYELKLTLNKRKIIAVTITDYYQTKSGRAMITNELIIKLLKKLNGKRLRISKIVDNRKIYKWETTSKNQSYRLFFWLKDHTTDHLWIRNIHPID